MKHSLAVSIIISLLILAICCKKSDFLPNINNNSNNNNNGNNNNNNNTDTATASAVGVPTGPSITQFISSGGGNVTSPDGRIEIDIPAGALPKGDTITIQNITNSASETSNGDAYRFLPNGLKFSIPVTIKFHYSDSDIYASTPDVLGIAFQDSANFWEPVQVTGLDTIAKTVFAQTTHFTDYASYRGLRIVPLTGDLLQQRKIFINKQELFGIYVVNKKNVGKSYGITTDLLADPTLWYVEGNAICCGAMSKWGSISPRDISTHVDAANYTAPSIGPPDKDNPVTLYAEVHILKDNPTLKDMLSHFFDRHSGSLQYDYTVSYKIRILDFNVYRFDIVDVQTVGCATAINVYDSASIFFRVGPDNSETYTISQDSIVNLPPLASPTGGNCGSCSYQWISDPVGTVNVLSATATYSGTDNSYFVLLNWVEGNENGVWYDVTCPNAGTTEKKPPSNNFGPIEIPMQINTSETVLDTLLEGTADQRHLRLVLVRANMN